MGTSLQERRNLLSNLTSPSLLATERKETRVELWIPISSRLCPGSPVAWVRLTGITSHDFQNTRTENAQQTKQICTDFNPDQANRHDRGIQIMTKCMKHIASRNVSNVFAPGQNELGTKELRKLQISLAAIQETCWQSTGKK